MGTEEKKAGEEANARYEECKQPMKIYLAGPFFNETEVRNVEYAECTSHKRSNNT